MFNKILWILITTILFSLFVCGTCLGKDSEADKSVVEQLIESLKAIDPITRWESARKLGEIKNTRAIVPLITALKDEDPFVRRRAAEALGNYSDSRAMEPLILMLSDRDLFVRKYAAESLEKITGPSLPSFGSNQIKWQKWWEECPDIKRECPDIKLLYPISNSIIRTSRPTFKWKDKSHDKKYIVYVERVGGDNYMHRELPPTQHYTTQYDDTLSSGEYRWWVCTAENNACSLKRPFHINLDRNKAKQDELAIIQDSQKVINIVSIINNLFYYVNDESARKKAIAQSITPLLKELVYTYLIPALTTKGFTVRYLGIQDQPPPQIENGTLLIYYNEEEGSCYVYSYNKNNYFAGNRCDSTGVRITCTLILLHPFSAKPFWEDEVKGDNSAEVNGSLHSNALSNLESEFKHLKPYEIYMDRWLQIWSGEVED